MKRKILLVLPKNLEINFINVSEILKLITRRSGGAPVLSLATIAALTLPDFDVKIIDEDVELVDFNESFDIVGIGGFSCYLNRAQEIAREFSKRGSLIVCGGSPVTFKPERWRPFADVLIVGEAERTWPQFLRDYLTGTIKLEYYERNEIDLSASPIPDFSGVPGRIMRKYFWGIVQTSRGCPYKCEFCSLHGYLGNKIRYKPVSNIIQEVEQLYKIGSFRIIVIADDNFSSDKKKAKEILNALTEWNSKKRYPVTFIAQVSIDVAKDEEFLELSVKAGLTRFSVGVETPNKKSLEETKKHQNVRSNLLEDIKKIHQHGILVHAGSIVGFDNDDLSIFQQQYDFFKESGIPNIQVMPLQAPDGSPLMKRMIKEGRYIDWEQSAKDNPGQINSMNTFTIIPKQMTTKQLYNGLCWLLKNLYIPENFIYRLKTFFENYEQSPIKDKLKISRLPLDFRSISMTARFIKFILTKATPKERKVFRKMYNVARLSSHPHKFLFLTGAFLSLLNTHNILRKSFPLIDSIEYPLK
ncbi:MAG: B12-binding domain-containing radical SAM protein [Bacteroidales bacterium]|nr:MAG: B12-binding domain-containing radical SAM protein [Bacteroidales bacterium]